LWGNGEDLLFILTGFDKKLNILFGSALVKSIKAGLSAQYPAPSEECSHRRHFKADRQPAILRYAGWQPRSE